VFIVKSMCRKYFRQPPTLRPAAATGGPEYQRQLDGLNQRVAALQSDVADLKAANAVQSHNAERQSARPLKYLTVPQFIERNGMSRSTWYSLKRAGAGPRTTKMGRSVRISLQAETEWLERMEKPIE
jgi:predicted DNA-binding transcriptional regulator AlpA